MVVTHVHHARIEFLASYHRSSISVLHRRLSTKSNLASHLAVIKYILPNFDRTCKHLLQLCCD